MFTPEFPQIFLGRKLKRYFPHKKLVSHNLCTLIILVYDFNHVITELKFFLLSATLLFSFFQKKQA
jgi:hypothetical protein